MNEPLSMRRLMVIVWHWSALEEKIEDVFEVEDSNDDGIVRINETYSPAAVQRLLEVAKRYSDAEIFFFLLLNSFVKSHLVLRAVQY